MAQVGPLGTTWNLPNYAGMLYTADHTRTPFLTRAGGMSGGGRVTENMEFPTSVEYDYPAAAQPGISEQASATAPAAQMTARTQTTNTIQIHQEVIDLTYMKQSNSGRMSGLNTAGQQPNPTTEKDWQIQRKLGKIARDIEFSFLQGTYQQPTAANVAGQTRGMIEVAAAGTTIAAGAATLTMDMLNQLYKEMADNGAYFDSMTMYVGAALKQKLTELYNNQVGFNLPATRTEGGANILQVITDFFALDIVWDPFMPDDTVLLADMAHVAPVFQPVPGKGNFFEEPLAKVGASDKIQIYGQIGLAHGASFLHGSITDIDIT